MWRIVYVKGKKYPSPKSPMHNKDGMYDMACHLCIGGVDFSLPNT